MLKSSWTTSKPAGVSIQKDVAAKAYCHPCVFVKKKPRGSSFAYSCARYGKCGAGCIDRIVSN